MRFVPDEFSRKFFHGIPLLAAFLLLGLALTASSLAAPPQAALPAAPEMTAADLDAFFDGFFPMQLQREDIAGAVVVVVKDGKTIFSRGYGFSDREGKKPVSPEETLFRPGSVSKLFTCTAVMQLVEQGKLDLDRDVNDYLDFKIRPKFGQPVTLRRIMTHTTGFEEVLRDLFISDARDLKPLREYLIANQPERIFAPGTVPAYSNYAMALAGYLVERVSGEKFETYVANHIYKPLGMAHSTFEQPLPPALIPLMSKGYGRASDPPKAFEVVQAAPAGSMAVSGADMARFMIAHLQDGKFGDARILKPETARLMHARDFAPDPRMPAMALAFFEETRNGRTMIGHGGDTEYFHSHMHLIPGANTGLFISLNSAGAGEADLRSMLWEKFTDRYFPGQASSEPPFTASAEDAVQVAGSYLFSRRADSTLLRPMVLLGSISIAAQPDGSITMDVFKGFNGKPRRFREIAPLLFQDVDGQDRLFFRPNSAGRMTGFLFFAAFALEKAAWYETKSLNLALLLFVVGIPLSALLFWPIAGLLRRHYQRPLTLSPNELRLRRWTRLVCAFLLLTMTYWTVLLSRAAGAIGNFNSHLIPWLYLGESLALLAALSSLVALWNARRALAGSRSWWSKIQEVLIAVACLGFVWMGCVWRLFHFSAKF